MVMLAATTTDGRKLIKVLYFNFHVFVFVVFFAYLAWSAGGCYLVLMMRPSVGRLEGCHAVPGGASAARPAGVVAGGASAARITLKA